MRKRKTIFRVRKEPLTSLAKTINQTYEVLVELVQLSIFLLLVGGSIGIVLVGMWRIRFWLG